MYFPTSHNKRNQTANSSFHVLSLSALNPVPGSGSAWHPNSGTTTTIEAEQVTIMVTEAMHTWAAGLKEQLIKIEINMKATSKESLNAKVI